jgi:outer membrane protein assembly factor BamB
VVLASGACPEARQRGETTERRREAIERSWRTAKPAAAPLLPVEPAWTLTLPAAPSAPAVMDHLRIYIPLREQWLVALDRETGAPAWVRSVDTAAPLAVGDGLLFVATKEAIRALDVRTGAERWSFPSTQRVTAPLRWIGGWLLVLVESGEAVALRASDGRLMWRRALGSTSSHPAVFGGDNALYLALADSRIVALALSTGDVLWEQRVAGTLSEPAVAKDRVFVGSTDNFFYAFDDDSGALEWKWRNGGDVIGAAADGDIVYLASLDNIIRAVNRGNGNQRWKKPTGTRPVLPPRTFGGVVIVAGLMPAITAFIGESGAVMGTHTAAGNLVGGALIEAPFAPFKVALVTITREGVVEALRSVALMFREAELVPVTTLPGRMLMRERLD